jgi:aminopeptidase
MNIFKANLEKYAKLTVNTALNIQNGQKLLINAPISSAEFTREVVKEAYEAGASNVYVEWIDDEVTLIKFMKAPDSAFEEYPMWKARGLVELAEENTAFLSIVSPNPDLLKEVSADKIATANKTASLALEDYGDFTKNAKVSWAIVSVPSTQWAAKVFPDLSETEAIDKLWDNIFKATRVYADNPISAWKNHIANLSKKLDYLNSKKFLKLHYSAPGTSLEVELPSDHVWVGGGLTNAKGTYFIPNMPTEEVFTMPLKQGVKGVVKSTKPLNYSGNLINNFTLTFENGKIIQFTAEEGYDTLKKLIETDEGSHYLGEVALVPHHSPVSDTGIIFYNTLFDENASSHFALGAAYPLCIKNGTNLNKAELEQKGANTSLTHVDFMIGSEHMNILGENQDGSLENIFINGNWAI